MEPIIVRFVGGPLDGERRAVKSDEASHYPVIVQGHPDFVYTLQSAPLGGERVYVPESPSYARWWRERTTPPATEGDEA